MKILTIENISFLKSKGFVLNKNGYFHIVEDNKEWVLIVYDNYYKLEFYEYGLYDGDDSYYDDISKEYSDENESLESFINKWF